jgi:hypothetical protein
MSGSLQQTLAPQFGAYDTAELVAYVRNLKLPTTFLLDKFFPTIVESDAPEVAIDIDFGKRRLAPFVSPLVEGKLVEARQWSTNLFRPAYIKDKRTPDLTRPVRRAIGERLLGSMSPMERYEANMAFEVNDQIEMVTRRLEWMACSALTTGTVTIVGDGYPSPVIVNFGRSASLTVALTGSAQWGQPGVSPTAWLTQWASQVLQQSGAQVTDVVLTNGPWTALLADLRIINAVWAPRSGSTEMDFGGRTANGGVMVGMWGQFRFWLYNSWYVDPVSDIEMPLLPDGTIILGSDEMQGVRAFGAILDPRFNYGPMAFAPKQWIMEDPAQLVMLMQSAPMVIPTRANAALCATVMAPGGSVAPPPI